MIKHHAITYRLYKKCLATTIAADQLTVPHFSKLIKRRGVVLGTLIDDTSKQNIAIKFAPLVTMK